MEPILKKVEDRLIKDLKETTLTFQRLGEKYGVTRQAVFGFCDRRGIKRLNRIEIDHTERCPIRKSLIRFARYPHSDFVTSHTIKAKLGIEDGQWGIILVFSKGRDPSLKSLEDCNRERLNERIRFTSKRDFPSRR